MSNFKIGQKVVCIEPAFGLEKNEIYTISGLEKCKCEELLFISEYKSAFGFSGTECPKCRCCFDETNLFRASRFRPLDHAFADEVEAMIKEQVKQEELVNI